MPASGVPAAARGPCRRRTGLTVYIISPSPADRGVWVPASGVPAAVSGPCRRRTGLTVYLPRRQRGLGASQRCPSCRQRSLQAADRTDCVYHLLPADRGVWMPASGVPAAASGPCRRRTGLTVYHLPRRQRGLDASQRCPSCRQWSLQAADRTDCIPSPPPTEGSGCQPAVSQLPPVVPAGGGPD